MKIYYLHYIIFYFILIFYHSFIYANSENLILGKKAFAAKQYDLAISYFTKEIKLNPGECNGYYFLGLTYERINQKEKSLEQFHQVTKTNCTREIKEQAFWKLVNYYKFVEDWENLYFYSKEFLKIKKHKEIEKNIELAEKNYNPSHLKIKNLLKQAKEYEEGKKTKEAADLYLKIFEETKKIDFLLKSANLYENIDEEQSIQLYQKILEYEPQQWYANFQIGLYYYNQGNPELAKQYVNQSYKNYNSIDKENLYYIQILKGYIYFNLEEWENFNQLYSNLEEFIKKEKLNKDNNFYILSFFYQIINKNKILTFLNEYNSLKLNPSYKKDFILINLLIYFLNNDYNTLKIEFINSFKNISPDKKEFIRFSNYWNQFYVILLIANQNDYKELKSLLELNENEIFNTIINKPYKNFIIKTFLNSFNFDKSNLNTIQQEVYSILENSSYEQYLKLLLLLNLYLINDYDKLNHFLSNINNLNFLVNNNIKSFYYYISSIVNLYNKNYEKSYEFLEKCIELNSTYKNIAKENPLVISQIEIDEKWKKLIEETSLLEKIIN